MKEILLVTINAKWIHPSLALRLLKANLGPLEEKCEILEFNLRQPLAEMTEPVIAARPQILGVSVSVWNHAMSAELLAELDSRRKREKERACTLPPGNAIAGEKPVVVLGGPEVSYLPEDAEIFQYADYVIRGEGETAFRTLCENILTLPHKAAPREALPREAAPRFISPEPVKPETIKSAYRLYSDEDLAKKLIYVESGRGCPFNCEFCLSAVKPYGAVREFPLDPFLAEMDRLAGRGARTFKFLDRTFNLNIKRALRICEFFLGKIAERQGEMLVHFEMVPSRFPDELREALARFPPGTLRLEIGIQTLNAEVSARIGRSTGASTETELETLRFLREKTSAVIHADLIAGLPGESLESFGRGFNRLLQALLPPGEALARHPRAEVQIGILKLLPGAPIARHSGAFGMCYNPLPPYEVTETAAMPADEIQRVKNFARFWELIVNRGIAPFEVENLNFENFMALSDSLFARIGRNWGIDKAELLKTAESCSAIFHK